MVIWRLVTHHESPKEVLEWATTAQRLAIGWGELGDLRSGHHTSAISIQQAIRQVYPRNAVSNAVSGGRSLWSFWQEMKSSDLVILSARGQRSAVMRVVGPYHFLPQRPSRLLGDYQHQREANVVHIDPDEAWDRAGGMAAGENIRWALIRCRRELTSEAISGES